MAGKLPETGGELWYAGGLRFRCAGCGRCCSGGPGYVWVTPEDIGRMAEFLGVSAAEFAKRYVRHIVGQGGIEGGESLTERANYDCIFLRREGQQVTCAVYEVRPMQCRTWPFWNQNLKNVDAWTQAAGRCPGMCDGLAPRHAVGDIERARTHPESPE